MPRTKLINGVRVPFTAQEEIDRDTEELNWVNNVKPAKEREQAFQDAEKAARTFSDSEIAILLAAYDEVQRYRIDNTVSTPIIDAINTVFLGQTKVQIGLTIESRAQSYLVNAATALANKIKDGG